MYKFISVCFRVSCRYVHSRSESLERKCRSGESQRQRHAGFRNERATERHYRGRSDRLSSLQSSSAGWQGGEWQRNSCISRPSWLRQLANYAGKSANRTTMKAPLERWSARNRLHNTRFVYRNLLTDLWGRLSYLIPRHWCICIYRGCSSTFVANMLTKCCATDGFAVT